ncbi:MAG: TonB-dependent receptor [Arachidicoccus sp.]|nr:TonB-dependent receptor [Arachidicoccus sp.]
MKKYFILVIALCFLKKSNSQQIENQLIKGGVKYETNQPAPFATVLLLMAKDSATYKSAISDEHGNYRFTNIISGKYKVQAIAVGKKSASTAPFILDENHANNTLPDLILKEQEKQLQGVTVSAQKLLIEQHIDKMTVNVEGSIIATGNNVLEVLQKIPGITVDQDGNISLKGKSGVTMMIDGKLTYLSADQLANLLRSMNSSQLSKIEIMTNPSAKYDAAGTAGIINIKLKKNSGEGMNGSANIGYSEGVHAQFNGGVNMNYKKGKTNFFGNFNSYEGKSGRSFNLTRKFYNEDNLIEPSLIMHQYNPQINRNAYQSFKAGIDYNITNKHTIGVMVDGSFSTNKHTVTGPIHFLDKNYLLDSTAISHTQDKNPWHSLTYDLNYKWEIDSSGQEITANFDYSDFGSLMKQNLNTQFFFPDETDYQQPQLRRGRLPSDIHIKSGKIDYTLPLKGNTKLEAGWKSSFVTADNNVQYENFTDNNWKNDTGSTNHFIYKENINALYFNFSKEFKKGWSLQAGLRGEQTVSKANQITIDSLVKRNYFQLFPSIFLRKKLNDNNSIGASYSRRIDRPDYQDLNPFTYYIDQYTYSLGNSFLQPQFTNSFELNYTYKNIIATLNYSHTSDAITRIIRQNNETHIAYETSDNLAKLNNLSLSFSVPVQITKWWNSNNYLNIFRNSYNGIINNGIFNSSRFEYNFNSTNTFTLPCDMKAELSGWYNSKAQNSVWLTDPQYSISFGLQKNLWNKKANLKLNVNDIFNTQRFKAAEKFMDIDMHINNKWESRRIALTFTYNFGNINLKTRDHSNSGIQDEQNRINK